MSYISAELRRFVSQRAGNCCEYCRLSQEDVKFSFHVEHIRSEKHEGKTEPDNLAWSCPACNGYKGSDIASADPHTDQATFLFHPRKQVWEDHFRLDGAKIEPLTAEGRVTVFLLRFNHPQSVAERAMLIRAKRYPCLSNKP